MFSIDSQFGLSRFVKCLTDKILHVEKGAVTSLWAHFFPGILCQVMSIISFEKYPISIPDLVIFISNFRNKLNLIKYEKASKHQLIKFELKYFRCFRNLIVGMEVLETTARNLHLFIMSGCECVKFMNVKRLCSSMLSHSA